jgi:hypothetical protein
MVEYFSEDTWDIKESTQEYTDDSSGTTETSEGSWEVSSDICEVTRERDKVSSEEVNAVETFLLKKIGALNQSNQQQQWRHQTVMTTRNHRQSTKQKEKNDNDEDDTKTYTALVTQQRKRSRQWWTSGITLAYSSSVTTAMGRWWRQLESRNVQPESFKVINGNWGDLVAARSM